MSATDQAIAAIRGMILDGELAPGQQIRQEEVSSRLGLSRNPIREALCSLTGEGLIEYKQSRGFFIAKLDWEKVEQIYLLRKIQERLLIKSIPKGALTKQAIADLHEANSLVAEAIAKGTLRDMVRANRAFHMAIFRLSPLHVVLDELQRLWNRVEYYHASYFANAKGRSATLSEHDEILDAIASRNLTRLATLLDEHRADATESLRRSLQAPTTVVGRDRHTDHRRLVQKAYRRAERLAPS